MAGHKSMGPRFVASRIVNRSSTRKPHASDHGVEADEAYRQAWYSRTNVSETDGMPCLSPARNFLAAFERFYSVA